MVLYFDGDDPDPVMRTAAARLRDDERFESELRAQFPDAEVTLQTMCTEPF